MTISTLSSRTWQALSRVVDARRLRNRVLLIGDSAGWIIQKMATTLRANLPPELRSLTITKDFRQARSCTIHFISRIWAWSDDFLDTVHPSNRLIGLWWHGRQDSDDPEDKASLDRVRRDHSRFVRMQVTCSIGLETLLKIGVPEENVVLLPMGIDLRSIHPTTSPNERERSRAALGLPPNAIAIGCFQKDGQGWGSGMEPKLVKGPDVLADVLERLAQRHQIVAVIPGPARGYLEQRLIDSEIPFLSPGWVPFEELLTLYHALDIYISPSRDEGGPAGALESMAAGIPLVSTRTGMPADMIENGVNGFLVDVEDVDGLVSCAGELINKPTLRTRFADNALQTIQPYDWPILSQRYAIELYNPVMGGSQ